MKNPFDSLGKPTLENPQGEEVGGQFSCQEKGCYKVAKEARYLNEIKTLTWICENKHISSIKDFELP